MGFARFFGKSEKNIETPAGSPTRCSMEMMPLLWQILRELRELRREVRAMADDKKTLDQAADDLGGAVTGKIAEDQVLRQQAAEGRNDEADVQKIEDLAGKLNDETAAEKAEAGDGSTPATPATPAPTDGNTSNVTVTGETASGQTVPDAPINNAPDAPATQQVPTDSTTTNQ